MLYPVELRALRAASSAGSGVGEIVGVRLDLDRAFVWLKHGEGQSFALCKGHGGFFGGEPKAELLVGIVRP